jgi:hypothetical protein
MRKLLATAFALLAVMALGAQGSAGCGGDDGQPPGEAGSGGAAAGAGQGGVGGRPPAALGPGAGPVAGAGGAGAMDAGKDATSPQPGGGAGNGGVGGQGGEVVEPLVWDPVWHEKGPAQWTEIAGAGLPDCGKGCRVVAQSVNMGSSDRTVQVSNHWAVFPAWSNANVDHGDPFVVAVDISESNKPRELLIDDGLWLNKSWGAGIPSVDGDLVVYGATSKLEGYIMVANLQTGERKKAWRMPKQSALTGGNPGVSTTAFAYPYAYWMYGGDYGESMHRFDLRDGSLKISFHAAACELISGTRGGLGACAGAGVGLIVVDFDNDSASLITQSPFTQANGVLSQDGSDAIWIDFRDPGPNGEHGSYDDPFGGEVYHKNLLTGAEERLTFDNPASPAMKTSPFAQEGDLLWVSLAGDNMPNPQGSSVFWYTRGPVVFARKGMAAVPLGGPRLWFPRPSAHGVVGSWWHEPTARAWVVLVEWPSP